MQHSTRAYVLHTPQCQTSEMPHTHNTLLCILPSTMPFYHTITRQTQTSLDNTLTNQHIFRLHLQSSHHTTLHLLHHSHYTHPAFSYPSTYVHTYVHTHLCILHNGDSVACFCKGRCAVVDVSDGDLDRCGCWLRHQTTISSNHINVIASIATIKVQLPRCANYSSGALREGWGMGKKEEKRGEGGEEGSREGGKSEGAKSERVDGKRTQSGYIQ